MSKNDNYRVYGYRWVVLAVFMFVNATIQILWITFGAITLPATEFYGVTDLQIGLLAMIFMIAYIPLSLPISWMIDTMGFYRSVSIGVILMGVFGVLRGFFGMTYTGLVLCTIGIAISQPFMMNSWTKVAARWFALDERAMAVGLASVANFLGTGIGLVLTPILIEKYSIPTMLQIYGVAAAVSAVLFILLAREKPQTPPCPPEMDERALMLDGLKNIVRMKPFWILMFVVLVGFGIFNGLSTWIENIVRPRGFTPTEAGLVGGLLLLGGIVGAFILPTLSDKKGKRKPFLMIGMIGAIPGLLGITFAQNYVLLLISAFVFGFFLVSSAPIGYQYAAEMTYPAPEGTSNGLLVLAGQVSVVFIYLMEAMKDSDGSFTTSLLVLAGLVVVNFFLITRLEESKLLQTEPFNA
jgi:MFS family permease